MLLSERETLQRLVAKSLICINRAEYTSTQLPAWRIRARNFRTMHNFSTMRIPAVNTGSKSTPHESKIRFHPEVLRYRNFLGRCIYTSENEEDPPGELLQKQP